MVFTDARWGCILTCKIKTCSLALQLVGRYFTIVNSTDRSVAYCRRVDTPPKIFLEDGTSWFLLGAAAKAEDLPAVTCTDSEDAGNMADPTNDFADKVTPNVNTAGNYYATWSQHESLERFQSVRHVRHTEVIDLKLR